jgi:hypothetical protein
MPSDGKSSHCLWQGELKTEKFISSNKVLLVLGRRTGAYREDWVFLAHLAKGNVSFCHHLASIVR